MLQRAREKESSSNFELETQTYLWLPIVSVGAKKWNDAYDNRNNDDGLDDLSECSNADVHNSIEDIDKEKNDNEIY